MILKRKKQAKEDFSKQQLPKTRKELFFFLFKNNRKKLFSSGVILLLFSLPIIASFILYSVLTNVLYQEYLSKSSQLSGKELEALTATYKASFISYTDIFAWILIIAILILFIGLAGLFCVIKHYSYNEPLFFKETFGKGVKQNAKQFIVTAIILGIINVLSLHMLVIDVADILKILPFVLEILVVLPIAILMCYVSSIYNEKYLNILAIAIRFYIGKIYLILPLGLMALSPFILLYLPIVTPVLSMAICYPLLAILLIFVSPLLLLIYFLVIHSVFDKTINKTNYPEIINKGLY